MSKKVKSGKKAILICLFAKGEETYFCDFSFETKKVIAEKAVLRKLEKIKSKKLSLSTIQAYQLKNKLFTDPCAVFIEDVNVFSNLSMTIDEELVYKNPVFSRLLHAKEEEWASILFGEDVSALIN